MFSVELKIAGALVFVVAVLGWTRQAAPPAAALSDVSGKGKAALSIQQNNPRSGSLKAVDAVKGTITLTVPPKDEYTYNLAKNVKVLIADGREVWNASDPLAYLKLKYREGTVADLQAGAHVETSMTLPAKMVVAIWAVGPTVIGVVGAVDANKGTVTLTFPGKKGAGAQKATYQVADDAIVFIDGKAAYFRDLVTEVEVRLTLSGDLKEAGKITAMGQAFNGFLQSVDAKYNSLTVNLAKKKSDPAVYKTFVLADGATILIYGQKTDLKKLAPGTHLHLTLSGSTKEVTTIKMAGRSVTGPLEEVDPVNNTVTLFLGKLVIGQGRTFKMLKDPQIILPDGTSGKLSDLKINSQVTLWFTWDEPDVVVVISCPKPKKSEN